MTDAEKIGIIIRHIKRVEDNCNVLAQKMMVEDCLFARKLIQAGRLHDASKFDFFEFEHLGNFEKEKPAEFFEALKIHHSKNSHHPEYWSNGIRSMGDIHLAEMVCDCVARGQEFGTDTRKWFTEEATKKYGFSMDDEVGKKITRFLDLLLVKAF